MRKLAIITPTLGNGGAERIISTISQYMQGKYDLTILAFDCSGKDYIFDGEIIDLTKKFSKETKFLKRFKFLYYYIVIKKIKKEMNYDIVLSFMENMGIINSITKQNETTVHAVSSFLSGQYQYSTNHSKNIYVYLFKVLIKKYFNKLDGILTISEESKQDLINEFKVSSSNIVVSYNPYDLKYITTMAEEKKINKTKQTIITVGSLIDIKAQWHLIRAFKKIKEYNNNIELIILGRGTNEDYLKEMVREYNLQEDVIFKGYVKNPFKYLKNSDIYVLTSIREGLPNALIEAMACGLPVISSDCSSGPREILAPRTNFNEKALSLEQAEFGILIPVNHSGKKNASDSLDNNELILANALQLLINDPLLRKHYSKQAIIRSKDYDVEKIMPHWIANIEKINEKTIRNLNEK